MLKLVEFGVALRNTVPMPAAPCTPGLRLGRAITCRKNSTRGAGSRYFSPQSATRAVSTRSGRKPRSTRCSRSKLRSISPAPTSSTTASAISTTTRPRRSDRPSPLDPRAPSFIVWPGSVRASCSAGTRPKTRPVRSDSATVKASTRQSIEMASSRGRSAAPRPAAPTGRPRRDRSRSRRPRRRAAGSR